jgi:type I restriction enzyme S subunit
VKLPAYPKYKPSGVEWLGDVPEKWEVKRLKYSASINDETLPETTAPDFEFRYVDIGGVDAVNGIVAQDEMIFENAPSRARRIVKDGDTIVSTVRTYLRAIAPIKNPPPNLIVSTGFAVVRPREVQSDFLSYAVRESSFVESVVARSTGVSYPAVNASEVGTIPITLPPPDEQRAIADFLEARTAKIDALLTKRRALIEKLKEKRTALISRAVTRGLNPNAKLKPSGIEWLGDIPKHWEACRLGFLVNKIGSGKTPSGGAQNYQSEGVMLIRSQNVYDDGLRLDDVAFIDEETDEQMAGSRVQPNDVLLNITGASLGRCSVVPLDFQKANVNQHVCIIRPNPVRVDATFVQLAVTTQFVKAQIFADEVGSSREGLNFPQVRDLKIPAPPLPEQIAIAAYLDHETAKIDRMVEKVELAIARLQEYRTALITAAVTGKIDVRPLKR